MPILWIVSLFIFIPLVSQAQKDTSGLRYPLRQNEETYKPQGDQKGVQLRLPSSFHDSAIYDSKLNGFWMYRKIGKTVLQGPYFMSVSEYENYQKDAEKRKYWNEKSKVLKTADVSTGFKPQIVLNSEAVGGIFGSNTISIIPQGSVELIFGINTSKIENPNLSERARKNTTFDFQQKTQMNVTGSIGDKLKLGVNYNTESTFEFENKTKLEYAGKEDEIIKKIEAGNVSLPLTGSLITGSQSLFGLKTEMQFGKLNVTAVASQQKGESSTIEVQGGASTSTFEVSAGNYEADKHYFLSHFFRDIYEKSLNTTPVISSGVVITKLEVWVTNRTSNYTDCRNILAFADLAESEDHIYNTISAFGANSLSYPDNTVPDNDINGLYATITGSYSIRTLSKIANALSPLSSQGFYSGKDYDKIENARKLASTEYTLNTALGYISLNSPLRSNEVLAVAYEYTYNGKTYKVGELSTSGISAPNTLVLKLIKGTTFTPKMPTWDLMMRNVYSLNASQISSDFELNVLYQNDNSGTNVNYIPETATNKDILLRVMGLDALNSSSEASPDGQFDFLEGVTVYASKGKVIFPVLEPFGSTMKNFLAKRGLTGSTVKKYIFQELYDSTQTKALQIAEKNKYILKGKLHSSTTSEISLNATNIPQGSVVVTAGGQTLTENIDYTVDYNLGTVKIINSGLLESATTIRISFESNSLYNIQTKTLLGTHLEYKFNDNFSLGGTIEHLSEKPLTSKVSVGDEPISNTIWGLNGTYKNQSNLITSMLDKLPLLQTKEPSQIEIQGEFAQLIPGHSSAIGKSGTLYLDDFEGSESKVELKTFSAWSLASIPQDATLFPESSLTDNLTIGKNRAKLAWYVIDPLFATMSSQTPSYIKNNDDTRSSHFVRKITEHEIFKNVDVSTATDTYISELNLAYYPKERGPYNFDVQNISTDGSLLKPEDRWAGIQRDLTTTNFETSNIEYIEFWMMDPFVEDTFKTNKGGNLYFDLGEVSEDVLKDSRKAFENGLPTSSTVENVDTTVWGRVANTTSLVDAFDNDASTRKYQDIGLDGLSDEDEDSFFSNYIDELKTTLPADSKALAEATADPSSDDFTYYLNSDYDDSKAGILARYKRYNGLEGNSPTGSSSSNSTLPNAEDIDNDNTLNETESFYQYKVAIKPANMRVGTNFIVDSVVTNPITFANGKNSSVTWYQFRIPIEEYEKVVGSIEDFTSIRFMRMFLHGFSDSVILRFAYLNLVRGEWRKYEGSLLRGGESVSVPENTETSFDISSVNIEENGDKTPVNYVLPPGVTREVDPTSTESLLLNEQSMVLKVKNLNNASARAAYKTAAVNLLNYGKMKMDVHAEEITGSTLADDELTLFIRMGSDYVTNYYEYEIPLKLTPSGNYDNDNDADRRIVWPDGNRISIDLSNFTTAKLARNKAMNMGGSTIDLTTVYPYSLTDDNGTYYVCGSPSLSSIKTVMIGIRFPNNSKYTGQTRSAEVWVNELRLTDFNEKGGMAANLQAKAKLADLGYLNIAGNFSTPGFGSIDQKISERSQEQTLQYNVSSNLELGKFLPSKIKAQIPFFANFSQTLITPEYDPTNPDIKLKKVLKSLTTERERDSLLNIARTVSTEKAYNLTNVRFSKDKGKPHFYDISNFTLNYSYSRADMHSIEIDHDIDKKFAGSILYNYQNKPKEYAPFQKMGIFKGKAFKIIRDFNFKLAPTNVTIQSEMIRTYGETKARNITDPDILVETTVDKLFRWNRNYDINFDLTRALKLDFSASNIAKIDEPEGIVSKLDKAGYDTWKKAVWTNIKKGGRNTHYEQNVRLSYTLPINKLPMLDWTNTSLQYSGSYNWNVATSTVDSLNTGNTIQNASQYTVAGQLNFTTLYNKVPFFKRLLQNKPVNKPSNTAAQNKTSERTKKVSFVKENTFLTGGKPKTINHKLKTEDVKVKVLDAQNREIKGHLDIVNANRVTFTSDSSYRNVKIMIDGTVIKGQNIFAVLWEGTVRALLSVRNISFSFSKNGTSTLPGFVPQSQVLGMDISQNNAPGINYVMGFQNKSFIKSALSKGWLSTNQYQNSPYVTTMGENVTIKGTLEPIPGFKIDLTGTRTYSRNESSYYTADADGNFADDTRNYTRNGAYSISFLSWGTAFEKLSSDKNYASASYNKFLRYRSVVANRLASNRKSTSYNPDVDPTTGAILTDGSKNGYGLNSQDVLIPAFMAAYGNMNPHTVTLSKFPSILHIRPNWKVSYDGLMKLDLIKRYFKSVSVNHAYQSTYNIGNYVLNSDYTYDIATTLSWIRDLENNFVPELDVSSISILEQINPLIGLNFNTINNISFQLQIKKTRNLVLNVTSSQITESRTNELSIGTGYTIKDFRITIKSGDGEKEYKSDLKLQGNLSIRDNKMLYRILTQDDPEPASGQKVVTLKLSADYMLSSNFNLSLFFDRIVNTPFVSSSYPSVNTNIGFSLKYTLSP